MLDLSKLIIMKLCQVVTGVKEAKYPSLNYQRCLLLITNDDNDEDAEDNDVMMMMTCC